MFVSSTCYDLKQIRQNIRDFIEDDLGYEAILSEHIKCFANLEKE
ncbi:DUF4062 domain-containing protein [Bariatricus sp. SGI.154]